MYFKKTYDWVCIILWIGVVVTLGVLAYALWYNYVDLSIAMLILLGALLLLLGYLKYAHVMKLKRRFVVIQETFTTAMLIYFSYAYFSKTNELPGEKALDKTTKKFDEVYEKTRYNLTVPLIFTALKTFGEIKNVKEAIKSEVKDFSTTDGFNLENAQSITREIGSLVEKLRALSRLVSDGFNSKKSWEEVLSGKPDLSLPKPDEIKSAAAKQTAKVKTAAKKTVAKTKQAVKSTAKKMREK